MSSSERSKVWSYGIAIQGAAGVVLIGAQHAKRRFLFGDPVGSWFGVLVDVLAVVVAVWVIVTVARVVAEAMDYFELDVKASGWRSISTFSFLLVAIIVWVSRVNASGEIASVLRIDASNSPLSLNALTALYAVFFPFVILGHSAQYVIAGSAVALFGLQYYVHNKKKNQRLADLLGALAPTLLIYSTLSTAFVPTNSAERAIQIVHLVTRTDANSIHFCGTENPVIYIGSTQERGLSLGRLPTIVISVSEGNEAALKFSLEKFRSESKIVACNIAT